MKRFKRNKFVIVIFFTGFTFSTACRPRSANATQTQSSPKPQSAIDLSIDFQAMGDTLTAFIASEAFATHSGQWQCGRSRMTAMGYGLRCVRATSALDIVRIKTGNKFALVSAPSGFTVDERLFFLCEDIGAKQQGEGIKTVFAGHGDCRAATLPKSIVGNLQSPFVSSVAGVQIRNAHWIVGAEDRLLRGMRPRIEKDYADLIKAGIKSVLLFKNSSAAESDDAKEISTLKTAGMNNDALMQIPFHWKDFKNFRTPCEQTLRGLNFILKNLAANRRVFFHCTVGEDRTGYLAGLYRMLTDPSLTHSDIFRDEMCEHGYATGNPQKPFANVAAEVDADLTPIYAAMAYKISVGEITIRKLKASLSASLKTCQNNPLDRHPKLFAEGAKYDPRALRCDTSTLIVDALKPSR